ncbi:MAG: divergent polysaccharide deacetylase family protein [Pseudomonadota bacterium]
MTRTNHRARPAFGLLSRAWIGLIAMIAGGFVVSAALDRPTPPRVVVLAEMQLPNRAPEPVRIAKADLSSAAERFAPPPLLDARQAGEETFADDRAPTVIAPSPPPAPRVKPETRAAQPAQKVDVVAAKPAPRIAILLAGLGLDPDLTEQAIRLAPPEVAFSFVPYGAKTGEWAAAAAARGHETGVELPMEAKRIPAETLGPAVLLTGRPPKDNLKRLDWMLSRSDAFTFATPYLGDAFRTNAAAMAPIAARLEQRNLAFLEDPNPAESAAPAVYSGTRAPYRRIDMVLTDVSAESLRALEKQAVENGFMLVKAPASVQGIAAIRTWAAGLPARGVVLTPPSHLVEAAERSI